MGQRRAVWVALYGVCLLVSGVLGFVGVIVYKYKTGRKAEKARRRREE